MHAFSPPCARDDAALAGVPENDFLDNTSEMRNWYPVAAAMNGLGWTMDLIDYAPCYRTEAGTDNAMAFATWEQ